MVLQDTNEFKSNQIYTSKKIAWGANGLARNSSSAGRESRAALTVWGFKFSPSPPGSSSSVRRRPGLSISSVYRPYIKVAGCTSDFKFSPAPPGASSSVPGAARDFKFSLEPPGTSSSVPSRRGIQVQSRPSRLQPGISSCGRRGPEISSCGRRRAGFQVEPVPSHLQP